MAKQRRVTATRSSRSRKAPSRKAARTPTRARRPRPAAAAPAGSPAAPEPAAEAPAAPPPARKPAYYEAIASYEAGVRALQRRDFLAAAEQFRHVIQRHPDERELVERATLYLSVCERQTANRAGAARTPRERIYAATVALNSGDSAAALAHLQQALAEDPHNDHGHYIMAVALSEQGRHVEAVEYLRKAIQLNPDNRSLARQDQDLVTLREVPAARELLESEPEPRRQVRARR